MSQKVTDGITDMYNNLKPNLSKDTIGVVLIFVLLFFVLYFIYLAVQQNKYNCELIKTFPKLAIKSMSNELMPVKLYKTYIKTAYNCCCNGDLKNGYVDTCALINCAKQGVRALDFTIYSLRGEPVIGTSTINSKKYKESYNSLPFSKTMVQVKQMFMYDTANCPNITDPLFLIFRIQSSNAKIYDKMADILQSVFGYGNSAGDKIFKPSNTTITDVSLMSGFKGKVMIMVDITGLIGYNTSKLSTITGLRLGTMENKIYRESDAFDLIDSGIDPNKTNVNILYPDYSAKSNNYDFYTVGIKQNFQFIGMNFQMNDVYMTKYNEFFKHAILKQPDVPIK
jgi:hypothetical protein